MRVLVGCPTSDIFSYCIGEFLERVRNLSYSSYDILMVDNSKNDDYYKTLKGRGINTLKGLYFDDWRQRVVHSRNMIIKHALENNYDYLLSLDQDVIPPTDVIETLMGFEKDIISGVYYGFFMVGGVKKLRPLLYRHINGGKQNLNLNEVEGKSLIEIDECGAGCLLIKRGVLKKVKFGLLPEDITTTDDVYFCHKAKKAGFGIFAYTGVKAVHKVLNRKRPYDK